MEIKRKIYQNLCEWKKSANGTKALMIEGARRIGKSTVAEEFGKNEYKSYILIDYQENGQDVFGRRITLRQKQFDRFCYYLGGVKQLLDKKAA